ncbi:hypothetical protein [Natrononativus amylolyticus]|uniref:hypothetical protein n=1 Tax=Natrononativus amylolyticus TaxID=2963434 RepID=UPI0020CFC99A|nr:hypothetical protein [Natrononativus amylolyticus]
MRRSIVIAVVVIAIAFLFVGGPSLLTSPSASDVAPEEEEQATPEVVSFEDSESGFWAYLNARESHEKRSPINVIVRGDTDDVVRLMTEEGDGDWEALDEDEEDAEPGTYSFLADEGHHATGTEWGEAAGTTRYAWIDPGDGNGDPYWATETLQLDNGDYYGERSHIRLYESPNPDDQWVAMQGHTEHFDWFTLRHRVDGVEAAQLEIESEFMALPQTDNQSDIQRINIGNSGPSDSDGWATLVDLLGMIVAPAVAGLALTASASVGKQRSRTDETEDIAQLTEVDRARLQAAYDRLEARHLVLAATILTLFLGVRLAGVALERNAPFLTMHVIAALLYPVIALGIPIATYAVASGLERRLDAAIVASLSLAVAIWVDYGLLGVDSLPVDVVLQRILVVAALGLIAGGAARRATRDSRLNDMLIAGVGMWALVLVGTLFGYF